MPGLVCLHLVSIVVCYFGASSVWITLVYFEPFLLHLPTLPSSSSLIFCLDTWAYKGRQPSLMSSLVTWENTLWAWGCIVMGKKMFSFSYKFWRWLLCFVKSSCSEEKCYQFWVNCYTQMSLRRLWISKSARLLYMPVNICFRVNIPSSKSDDFSVFIVYP